VVLEHDVYHERWLTSTTLVLHKIDKPAYDVAKAYRPIGLLDTIGKLLSTLVTANLSYLAEKHHMLPPSQFGGCPEQNMTNAMHIVTHKIKDAWRTGKVAITLFHDIQGAFPNTVKEQLLHNMKTRSIPSCYSKLIERMLTERKTCLKFDNFTSDPIDIINSTTQGCPLSMILYAFYNTPLIQVAIHRHETSLSFVDDFMFLAIANTISKAHTIIKDMMERLNGGFEWSTTHNSPFKLSKLALMNFPHSHYDIIHTDLSLSRLNLNGTSTHQTVKTVASYKYLGVTFDPKLCWSAHLQKVIASTTWWSSQVAHLSKVSGGMPPRCIRQLYNTVAVPAFTYVADIWYTGIRSSSTNKKRLGSITITKKLIPIQCQISKLVTGALSTTAGDILDVHANLLPIDLLFSKVLFQATVRIVSLPATHPLYKPACKAAKHSVRKHHSPLHNLFEALDLDPNAIELIAPTQCHPNYAPFFSTLIPTSKPIALREAEEHHHNAHILIYCDGSGFEEGIGTSAVMYINSIETKHILYYLGPASRHTVYKGEIVGITLALHLLTSLQAMLRSYTVIDTDSQATILAFNNQKPHPTHYLLDHVHDATEKLHINQLCKTLK